MKAKKEKKKYEPPKIVTLPSALGFGIRYCMYGAAPASTDCRQGGSPPTKASCQGGSTPMGVQQSQDS